MKIKSLILTAFFTILGLVVYLNSSTRDFIINLGVSNERTVLATIETEKLKGPHPFKILKIKEGPKIWLEIYYQMPNDKNKTTSELHTRLDLRGEFDGHVLIMERATNLAISNIDRDNELEILAPTYSRGMTPILNIYKYDPILEEFKFVDMGSNGLQL